MSFEVGVLGILAMLLHSKPAGEGVKEVSPAFILSLFISLYLSYLIFPPMGIFVAIFFLILAFFAKNMTHTLFSILIQPVKISVVMMVILGILLLTVMMALEIVVTSWRGIGVGVIAFPFLTMIVLWLMDVENGYQRLTEKLINK